MSAYTQLLVRLDALSRLGVELGLDRVQRALAALGSPETRVPAVHIAGTNGKGSTAAMVDAVLRAAGLRVGLFTSPHLMRFTERFRIDGEEMDGAALAELDPQVAGCGVSLTYFEASALLAFCAFDRAKVDVAVLETGLGGRLDATTACRPLATGITSIALDHTDLLGPTLSDIAGEKAGICKPGIPLVVGAVPAAALDVISAAAAAAGAPLHLIGRDFVPPPHLLALGGAHQRNNAAVAVALAGLAAHALGRELPEEAIERGLAGVRWPGRLEWLDRQTLLDGAHNVEGARALVESLPPLRSGTARTIARSATRGRRALVVSVARGKDARGMLKAMLPAFDAIVVTRSASPRAMDPDELAATARSAARESACPIRVLAVPDPVAALERARAEVRAGRVEGPVEAGADLSRGVVVVSGSLFLVGQVRAALTGELSDPIPVSDPLPLR